MRPQKEKRPKLIKAYHQVGTDSMSSEDRAGLLDLILGIGDVLPATQRVQRKEMYDECFNMKSEVTDPIYRKFPDATPKAMKALEQMAREWVNRLPEEGSAYSLFNCTDLLAGDLDNIFLSVDSWYQAVDNGFVFDAEELLLKGAHFRHTDLLGHFDEAIQEAVGRDYPTVKEARWMIEGLLTGVLDDRATRGKEGIFDLWDCVEAAGDYEGSSPGCHRGEVVWTGPLPVDLAIEIWREGKLIHRRKK